jgi:hypothetical protein
MGTVFWVFWVWLVDCHAGPVAAAGGGTWAHIATVSVVYTCSSLLHFLCGYRGQLR